jgi:DNA gyrase subunit A
MGVKFVTPKGGDAVAVVTRSVEAPEDVLEEATATVTPSGDSPAEMSGAATGESPDMVPDATIDDGTASPEVSPETD